MRKKLAAIVCALMCLTAFTGCSSTELGYLQMGVDMLQSMETSETEGSTEITVDFDALKSFAGNMMLAGGMTQEDVDQMLVGMEDWQGEKTIVLDYSMMMNMDDMSYYLDLDAQYQNQQYSFGRWYYGIKDGVYVSTETVWSVYRLMEDMAEDKDSYFFSEAFAQDLKSMVTRDKYICLVDMQEDLGLTAEELDALIPTGGYQEVYTAVLDLYRNGFADFTTDLVSAIPGGYRMEADGAQVGQLLVSLLDYVAEHPDTVLNALMDYFTVSMQASGMTEEEIAEVTTMMNGEMVDMNAFSSTVLALKTSLEAALEEEAIASVLNGFHYEEELIQSGGQFRSTSNTVLENGNDEVFRIASSATMQQASGSVVFPSLSIKLEEMMTNLQALTDQYNPVTGVSAVWYPADGDNIAILTETRAEQTYWGMNNVSAADYVVQDGRIYLPLRDICDMLGETVTWDSVSRTASIVRDTGNVPMDTILVDGTSYIGVRGMEALGYQVNYTNADGEHIAEIMR